MRIRLRRRTWQLEGAGVRVAPPPGQVVVPRSDAHEHPIAAAALEAIAITVARVPMVVHEGSYVDLASARPLPDHPLTRRLNDKANRLEDAVAWRTRQALRLLLDDHGVITWHDEGWSELWILDGVRPVLEGGELRYLRSDGTTFGPEEVVWHRRPDAYSLTSSCPVAPRIEELVRLSARAVEFVRRWIEGDGGVRHALVISEELPQADIDALRLAFSRQYGEPGRVEVIAVPPGAGATVMDVGGRPGDLGYAAVHEAIVDDLLLSLRVPKSVLGDASGRTYANAQAEQAVWAEWVLEPLVWQLALQWSAALEDGLIVVPETAAIAAVRRAHLQLVPQLAQAVLSGIMTTNEAREVLGLSPLGRSTSQREESGQPRTEVSRARPSLRKALRGAAAEEQRIGLVRRALVQWLDEVETRAVREARGETKDQIEGDWLGEQMLNKLVAAMSDAQEEVARRAWQWFLGQVEVPHGLRDEVPEYILELVRARTPVVVGQGAPPATVDLVDLRGLNPGHVFLPQRVQQEIRDIVAEGLRAGLPERDITAAIRERFNFYREHEAERIARTEAHWASQRTIAEAIKQSPAIVAKEWVAVGDDRTRETHAALDGVRVGAAEQFVVGGYRADGPGMTGIPEEDINCRCQLVEVTELREEIEDILS